MRAPFAPPRAIVLDLAHPRAVAVVQSLWRRGVEVVGVDHRPWATGFSSRGLASKILIDAREGLTSPLGDFLETLARDGRGGLLVPTSDDYLVHVARHHAALSRSFIVPLPPGPVFDLMLDREACYRVARDLGIATPRSFAPQTPWDLDALLGTFDFSRHDYVIKTGVDDVAADVVTQRHTKVGGRDAATLRARWSEIAARSRLPPTIERIVPGEPEQCVGVTLVMDRASKAVVAFATRRLRLYRYARGGYRHPYELGANVYCETMHDDEAIEAGQRLLRAIGFYGVATVEFRRDSETGVLTLIKVDPRVVRATSLSAAIGMDVPAALYQTFAHGAPPAPRPYRSGVRWMWVSEYIAAVRQHATWRSVPRDLAALLRTLPRLRALAFFTPRDPLPFLESLTAVARPPRPLRRVARRLAGTPRLWPQV